MNFDLINGALCIDSPSAVIDCGLTPATLSASALVSVCQQMTQNAPWELHGFVGIVVAAERFSGMIAFEHQTISFLTLSSTRPEFGTSWADMTQEKEAARQRFHDRWLELQLNHRPPASADALPPYPRTSWQFAWGEIASTWDFKNGTSEIVIRYGPRN